MAADGRRSVILAGDLGTRLEAPVETTPKPILTVGGRLLLEHLVRSAHRFGFDSFRIKGERIRSSLVSIHQVNLENFLRLVVPPRNANKIFVRWGEEMASESRRP